MTDDHIARRPDLHARALDIARAGIVALHSRAPGGGGRTLYELAEELSATARTTRSAVFVNDRVDIAVAAHAQGVHLPGRGLPTAAVRKLTGSEMLVGRSTHDPSAARAALREGADYVFLGPVFPTPSHPDAQPLGPAAIEAVGAGPVIAIGGVTADRVRTCVEAGAHGVAVVTALWSAQDPGRAAADILLLLE